VADSKSELAPFLAVPGGSRLFLLLSNILILQILSFMFFPALLQPIIFVGSHMVARTSFHADDRAEQAKHRFSQARGQPVHRLGLENLGLQLAYYATCVLRQMAGGSTSSSIASAAAKGGLRLAGTARPGRLRKPGSKLKGCWAKSRAGLIQPRNAAVIARQ
jgi:hypothetical protein